MNIKFYSAIFKTLLEDKNVINVRILRVWILCNFKQIMQVLKMLKM